jgi:hypothetical protein
MLIAHHRESPTLPSLFVPRLGVLPANQNPSLGVNNIPRIAETKSYRGALRAYLMVVTEIHISRHHDKVSSFSTFSWLERACFGLVSFVMQCELS